MLRKATALWIVGLVTIVPYATWHLFFRAPREQYAALITFLRFWVFGSWGLVGPVVSIVKVRSVFRAIQQTQSRDELVAVLRSEDAQNVAIDHIASEYRIPRLLATRVLKLVTERLAETERSAS